MSTSKSGDHQMTFAEICLQTFVKLSKCPVNSVTFDDKWLNTPQNSTSTKANFDHHLHKCTCKEKTFVVFKIMFSLVPQIETEFHRLTIIQVAPLKNYSMVEQKIWHYRERSCFDGLLFHFPPSPAKDTPPSSLITSKQWDHCKSLSFIYDLCLNCWRWEAPKLKNTLRYLLKQRQTFPESA